MNVLNNMNYMDTYNAITGAVVAFLSFIFGEHWFLFAAFLVLNIIDWFTGWMKSRIAQKTNSAAGWKGVLKKIGYWIMVLVAFMTSALFIEIGKSINIDLGVTTYLGWFVLASLLVNEIRSILENFVEAGYNVPAVLTKGLEVADKLINSPVPCSACGTTSPAQCTRTFSPARPAKMPSRRTRLNRPLRNEHTTRQRNRFAKAEAPRSSGLFLENNLYSAQFTMI